MQQKRRKPLCDHPKKEYQHLKNNNNIWASWHAVRCSPTLTAEQEVAHVEAEGAADVAAAVRQGTRQAATVEGAKGVGAVETQERRNEYKVALS